MSDLASKILKFSTLDIETYLDENFPKYEHFLIETEKHNISKIKNEVDTELFKTFLQNSDNLLNILNAYEESYKIVTNMIDSIGCLNRLRFEAEKKEEAFVDKRMVEKFKQILNEFSSDTTVFATENRYLVHFDTFKEDDDNMYILILTNDILLIGKIGIGANKYSLVNAYNYNIIQMDIKDNVLIVNIDPHSFKFSKDDESINKVLRIYQEITYNYEESSEMKEEEEFFDEGLGEYLVYTEQYDQVLRCDLTYLSEAHFTDKESMVKYLKVAKTLDQEISDHLFSFLESKFIIHLSKVNKVQPFDSLVDETFNFFYGFFSEQENLIKEVDKIKKIRKCGSIILIEKELLLCLSTFKSRVFNKEYQIKCMESSINHIKEKLRFHGYDFSYLIKSFLDEKDRYKNKCLENAKKEIDIVLKQIVDNNSIN